MIYIEVLHRYWNPGKRMLREFGDKEINQFHSWLAEEYKNLIVKAINDQRYKDKWPALSRRYLEYKRRNGYSTGMWEMTGELKDALIVKKVKGTYHIRFPKKKHEGTNLYYVELAQVLEFGNLRIPPRPLFRKAYLYMSSNISYYYEKYQREVLD